MGPLTYDRASGEPVDTDATAAAPDNEAANVERVLEYMRRKGVSYEGVSYEEASAALAEKDKPAGEPKKPDGPVYFGREGAERFERTVQYVRTHPGCSFDRAAEMVGYDAVKDAPSGIKQAFPGLEGDRVAGNWTERESMAEDLAGKLGVTMAEARRVVDTARSSECNIAEAVGIVLPTVTALKHTVLQGLVSWFVRR